MRTEETALPGISLIIPDVFADKRGYFLETFQEARYAEALNLGKEERFVQDNLSYSKQGVVRGLHYQAPPCAQGKLVSVLSGRVLDVAVDIRQGSPTYGKHVMIELSAENHLELFIPAGFAHGFAVLSPEALFAYKCTAPYSKEYDRGLRFDDPELGIDWQIGEPLVSEKDRTQPLFRDLPPEFTFHV